MDTVGVERKEGEQHWTVFMVKLGKKQLYLQCCNTTGTVNIYQPFSYSCRLPLVSLGNALVLDFKERYYNKHFHSSVKRGREQSLTIVFENVEPELPPGPIPQLAQGNSAELVFHINI